MKKPQLGQTRCKWPRGCEQWAHLSGFHYAHRADLCTYHDMALAGMIDMRGALMSSKTRGVPRSAVITDEQREIAEVLRLLGAHEGVIRAALAKGARATLTADASKGTGVRRGRIESGAA